MLSRCFNKKSKDISVLHLEHRKTFYENKSFSVNKKLKVFLLLVLVLFSVNVLADVTIQKRVINDVVISEVKMPATFGITLTNNGADDYFSFYSLVGVKITSEDPVFLLRGESKEVIIDVNPNSDLKHDTGSLVFVYKVKGENSGVQEDTLTLNVVQLSDAFSIGTYPIDAQADQATVYFKNKYNVNYKEIRAKFSSAFFSSDEKFSLGHFEKKEFQVPIDREKTSLLGAG